MMTAQLPVLIVAIPLIAALFITLLARYSVKLSWGLTVLSLFGSFFASVAALCAVIHKGPLSYEFGNWPEPLGIIYVVDHLNILVLCVISLVAFLVSVFSKQFVMDELGDRVGHYYTLFVLLVVGLLGITITGDAFNLYVLLEVSSLTSYALMAVGRGRAYISTFNYLMMGTIGACLYLLGVGYLLIKLGTLNMANMAELLPLIMTSKAILIAFIFIAVGMLAKMAFFPLHGWMPNAYTYAPTATSCLAAPLMTKVSVYVLIRMMFTVFTPEYVFGFLTLSNVMVFLACISIVVGSFFALSQTHLKKLLTYLIVAEMGYMVGGVWLGNALGATGAIYHIVADALMTACLFMVVSIVIYKTGKSSFDAMKGIFRKMPLTGAAFLVGAFSMIGIPPTCGFFSKWYLLSGAYQAGHWLFFGSLIFSSLVNVVLFFRLIEIGFFHATPDETPDPHAGDGVTFDEAPASMVVPLLVMASMLILVGLSTSDIVTYVIDHAVPAILG